MMLCVGCRGAYLMRLAWEEARYLHGATPATELLASAGNPDRRRALEALLDARDFAAREGLDVGGSFRSVATTAAPFDVVTAAYVDRLEPYTWWYPVVGAIPYRGYFDPDSAQRYARTLRERGLDTMVVKASAYSTLGWFDDPLPSGVIDRGDGAVVVTVLHELVHQTFFAPGQVAFNETLATAASWRLAERYWASKGDPARAHPVALARQRWIARSDALDSAAATLEEFFARAHQDKLGRAQMLVARARVYQDVLRRIELADQEFAAELRDGGLDNASFLAAHRYATAGRAIDVYLAAWPSVSRALANLKESLAKRQSLSHTVPGWPEDAREH